MTTTATLRPIDRIVTVNRQEEGGGFVVRRPFPTAGADRFDAFLLLDEVGPVTCGAVEHRDSTGAVGVIRPGVVQWMTAGSGIVQSELADRGHETLAESGHLSRGVGGSPRLTVGADDRSHGRTCGRSRWNGRRWAGRLAV